MPPLFGLPPAIQKMSVKLASARAAASALVALESLTNSTLPLRPTCSMRCARPGKDTQALLDRRPPQGRAPARRRPRRRRSAHCARRAATRCRRSRDQRARGAARGLHHLIGFDIEPVRQRPAHRDAHDPLAGALDAVGDRLAPVVVDADDRGPCAARDQPLLDRRVVLASCRGGRDDPRVTLSRMPIEGSSDGARSIWNDEHSITCTRPGAGGSSERIAVPILPPSCASYPALIEQMRDQRGRGRFAVGAGDRDERRVGRDAPPLAAEQLDVADHLDGRVAREPDRPVRRRMGQRHAGREHQRGDPAPVDMAQVRDRDAGGARLLDRLLAVVPRDRRRRRPRAARSRSPGRTRRGRTARRFFPAKLVTGIIAASASRGRPAPARSQ